MAYGRRLMRRAEETYPCLYGGGPIDLYLGNGARLYLDIGYGLFNVEYATGECPTPRDLVAHVGAGDGILAGLAADLAAEADELANVFVSKCNLDYHGHTSGSHENYLIVDSHERLARELIPYLVTRQIFSGGGGFDNRSPGLDSMLSPRVRHLELVKSRGAQSHRGIFTRRDEAHASEGYGRLHLLCGEGVRCQRSEYLRFAVTALLIHLVAIPP
jgi:proteasome accessory factor A